ncbi:MAG: BglII/BstYI family type II restriction endonuclease [Phycisphaerales bacterium]
MAKPLLPSAIRHRYEVHEWKHASAILAHDFPDELADILTALTTFRVRHSHITVGGGGKTKLAQEFDSLMTDRGWAEKKWDTRIVVDAQEHVSPTHRVDCYKNRVALELEWSNKDPFYDRDLNNFRLLFDLRAISVGVIVTKHDSLNEVFESLGIAAKYGTSTTWLSKLLPRVEGGGGGGCPLLVFGITKACYLHD